MHSPANSPTPVGGQWTRQTALLFLLSFILLASLISLHRWVRGQWLGSGDDYGRLGYAMHWAHDPFFATDDHLWLGGNFAILGSAIALAKDPMEGVLLFSLLSWGVLAGAFLLFARVFGVPPVASGTAAAMALLHPATQPLLLTSMPDVLFWGLTMGGMAAIFRAWIEPDRGLPCIALGTLLLSIGTTLRYEAWVLSLAASGCLYAWLWCHGRGRGAAAWGLAFLGLLPFVYPTFWISSSAARLGDPLRFARNEHNPLWRHYTWGGDLRLAQDQATTLGGRLRDFLHPVKNMLLMAPVATILALVALLPGGNVRHRLALLVPVVWVGTVGMIAFRSGISGNSPERLAMIAALSLTLIGTAAVLARAGESLYRQCAALAVLVGALALGNRLAREHTRYRPHLALDTSAITMGLRMRYEFGPAAEFLEGVSHKKKIALWGSRMRGDQGEFNALRALSGEPERFVVTWRTAPPLEDWISEQAPFVLSTDIPPVTMEGAGYRALFSEGTYTLWAREEPLTRRHDHGAVPGGTAREPTLIQHQFGLEWLGHAPMTPMTWEEAASYAEALEYAGHDDWRLPSIEELWKISAHCNSNEPGFDQRLAPRVRYHWSSSPGPDGETRWVIDFARLFPLYMPPRSEFHVRPVRSLE